MQDALTYFGKNSTGGKHMPASVSAGELSPQERYELGHKFSRFLAANCLTHLKTLSCQWNPIQESSKNIVILLAAHTTEMNHIAQQVSKRLRDLHFVPPATYREFTQISPVQEEDAVPLTLPMVITSLSKAHGACKELAWATVEYARKLGDKESAVLAEDGYRTHERAAWALQSLPLS